MCQFVRSTQFVQKNLADGRGRGRGRGRDGVGVPVGVLVGVTDSLDIGGI